VAAVLVREAGQRAAVGQPQPALGALEGLDRGLLVDAQDHCVVGRVEVQAHDVGRLGRELGVGRDAPAAPSAQADALGLQHAPDVDGADVAQRGRQQVAGPGGVPGRWRLIEQVQDALRGLWPVSRSGPRARRVGQARHPLAGEAGAPLGHPCRPRPQAPRDLERADPIGGGQDHARPLGVALFGGAGPQPALQRLGFSFRQVDGSGRFAHAGSVAGSAPSLPRFSASKY